MELKDKVALVTGGAQGIGRTISEELARAGAHVVLGDVNLEGAQARAEAINNSGGSASAVKIDVSNATEVREVFDFIMKDKKPVDIVVNNAGITRDGLMVRMKESDWDLVLNINLKGSFLCSQQATKQMMKQKSGAIVNIASITSFNAFPLPAYSPSKAAVKSLTELLSVEYGRAGVRVNAVAPSYTLTPAIKSRIQSGHRDPDSIKGAGALHVFVEPRHIADGIHFLCSDASEVITGVTLPIDAGWLAARGYNHYVGGKPWEA
mgnify:CR=1 FL=1